MAVNQERVNAVCDELAQAGKKATLAAVRDALGEGSFSTIGPMVQNWKAGRGDVAADAGAVVVPDAVLAMGGKLIADVWTLAERLAAERLAAERTSMATAREEMGAELAQAYADMETLREELAQANEKAKASGDLSIMAGEKVVSLKIELAAAKAEASAYKVAIDKFNPQVNQEQPKKPVSAKKTGKAIAKTNEGPIDTRTAPLSL